MCGKDQPAEERPPFWVRREGGARYGGRDYYAVQQGPWKLVQNTPFEEPRLYNLAQDPSEQDPLLKRHPKYAPLFRALQGHINAAGAVSWEPPMAP